MGRGRAAEARGGEGAGGGRRARPRKRFGQHFLEPAWADKVVEAISPRPADDFLEIGPGPGILTMRLAPRVAHLTAIEVDRDLAARLRATVPPNVTVVEGDFLEIDVRSLQGSVPCRVAGNLPYNISSLILFKLLRVSREPGAFIDATIMLQREVADRLVAPIGTADYGVLTILTALYADSARLLTIPPGAFRPMPKVYSAVVRLTFRPPPIQVTDPHGLESLVRSIFTQRRKTLGNALRAFAESVGKEPVETLQEAGIDPKRRPETLDLPDLVRLWKALGPPRPHSRFLPAVL